MKKFLLISLLAVTLTALLTAAAQSALWHTVFLHTAIVNLFSGLAIVGLVYLLLQKWIKNYLAFIRQTLQALVSGRRPPPPPEDLTDHLAEEHAEIGDLARRFHSNSIRSDNKKKRNSWLDSLRKAINDRTVVIVANREPYIHERKGDTIKLTRPASGLVTALEPILRQCGGLWIAHGSGSADQEMSSQSGEIQVPPEDPRYTLRRVWLTKEQELGYYYGFSNEGLWPLCHLAHTRPTFRLSDWQHYCEANSRFADATPDTVLSQKSLILVQDYHFALLPRLLKNRALAVAPNRGTKIGLFWHIPWPNPEAFGICPWHKELLHGMLGADVIGFHTQYHCNNFLETCDRYLEARIDWENFSVTMENHETLVRAFPIGIDTSPVRSLNEVELQDLRRQYGVMGDLVAVGVDRLDYTKGLIERMESVERLLEKNPHYVGRFSLVQMGSPSRTHIPAYQDLTTKVTQVVDRVNLRFGNLTTGYKPIIFLPRHHEWSEIQYFYQMGDVCMVTSLHDGMNLVAKEYVWCQKPERGALILSRFAGASRELSDAFIVNPYSIEEMADALASAIELPTEERARRMLVMRDKVENHNAFHWASDLIRALLNDVRVDKAA